MSAPSSPSFTFDGLYAGAMRHMNSSLKSELAKPLCNESEGVIQTWQDPWQQCQSVVSALVASTSVLTSAIGLLNEGKRRSKAVVTIQAGVRRHAAERRLAQAAGATKVVQSGVRGHLARRERARRQLASARASGIEMEATPTTAEAMEPHDGGCLPSVAKRALRHMLCGVQPPA